MHERAVVCASGPTKGVDAHKSSSMEPLVVKLLTSRNGEQRQQQQRPPALHRRTCVRARSEPERCSPGMERPPQAHPQCTPLLLLTNRTFLHFPPCIVTSRLSVGPHCSADGGEKTAVPRWSQVSSALGRAVVAVRAERRAAMRRDAWGGGAPRRGGRGDVACLRGSDSTAQLTMQVSSPHSHISPSNIQHSWAGGSGCSGGSRCSRCSAATF